MHVPLSDAQPLKEALRDRNYFPIGRKGKDIHFSTPLRWHQRGVLAANGERVFLRITWVGGVAYVIREDVQAFFTALNSGTPSQQAGAEAEFAHRSREAGNALENLGC